MDFHKCDLELESGCQQQVAWNAMDKKVFPGFPINLVPPCDPLLSLSFTVLSAPHQSFFLNICNTHIYLTDNLNMFRTFSCLIDIGCAYNYTSFNDSFYSRESILQEQIAFHFQLGGKKIEKKNSTYCPFYRQPSSVGLIIRSY